MDPALVGLILDSSVIITGERRGYSVRKILEQLQATHGDIEMGVSVVTIVELTHGIQRAADEQRRQRRQAFVDELIRDVPVHPVNLEIARLAGRVEGEQARLAVGSPSLSKISSSVLPPCNSGSLSQPPMCVTST